MRFSDIAFRAITASLCVALLVGIIASPAAAAGPAGSTMLQVDPPDVGDGGGDGAPVPGDSPAGEGGGDDGDGPGATDETDETGDEGETGDGSGTDTGGLPPPADDDTGTGVGAGGGTDGSGDGGGGGGGIIGGFGPSPTEWATSLLTGLANAAIESFETGIDRFTEEGIGIPAPGEPDDRSSWTADFSGPIETWGDDIGGIWSGAVPAHFVSALFGMIWLLMQFIRAGSKGPKERRSMYERIAVATVMILAGHHLIAPFTLHAFNEFALAIAPDGADFTGSVGDLARLGIGVIFGALLVVISSFTFVLGLVAIELTDALIYIIYGSWGLMWAAWASAGQARAYGQQGVFTLGALLALAPLQALVLYMVFNITWTGDVFDPITVLIGTSAGLAIAFIYLPWTFLKQTVMGAATALGAGAALASTQIDAALDEHVAARVEQYHSESESNTIERPTGSVQSQSGGGYIVTDGGSEGRPDAASWGGPPRDDKGRFMPLDEYESQESDRIDYTYK